VADCAFCGAKLPRKARFCAECGRRVEAVDSEAETTATVVQEVPPHETGPVPVNLLEAEPRFFGVTPATALFGLALAALALGILLVVIDYVLAGALLLGASLLLFAAFATASQRRPDTAMARLSADAIGAVRARAGFAVETLAAHGSARVEFYRLRRAVVDLHAERAAALQDLGEAVYRGDEEAAASGRDRVAALDRELEARNEELMQVTTRVEERVRQAQLQVQPTEVRQDVEVPGPVPVPEPSPEPSPPVEPPQIPEPSPEPSPPVEPPQIPEPGPTPAPEPGPTAEGAR
jgi:outer membrane biosynthesis protein TonB